MLSGDEAGTDLRAAERAGDAVREEDVAVRVDAAALIDGQFVP